MSVRKAVITAAGLGTRLLPITKEIPKEMLPLYDAYNGNIGLKPVIQIVFESLYEVGVREFCFITGRGKRVIEDFFTPDKNFLELLSRRGLSERGRMLEAFYKLIENSRIFFINQPEPRGFGDAVLRAEPFVGSEPFILHAGDDIVLSNNSSHLDRLIKVFKEYDADSTILVEEVADPRPYGVITGKAVDQAGRILRVTSIVEKPEKPVSNTVVIAIYIFKPIVFNYLKHVKPGYSGEIQLTDAIKLMIDDGHEVYAVKLHPGEKRLDVGDPEKYWQAFKVSYEYSLKRISQR